MRRIDGCLFFLLASTAVANAEAPAGRVEIGGWSVRSDLELLGYDFSAGLDLAEEVRLEAYLSEAPGAHPARVGYGELSWGALRLGGGLVGGRSGNDGGLHLGYRPSGEVELMDGLVLRAGFDAALGLAFFERSGPVDRSGPWKELPEAIDAYATSLATFLELRARPAEFFLLSLRGYGDAFLAQAPAATSSALHDLSKELDLSLGSALSDVALGGHAQATLRLLRSRFERVELLAALSYREAWDWIHLDPSITLFAHLDGLDPYHVEDVPWRSIRRLALHVAAALAGGPSLALTLDAQHVQDSTTSLEFADRNGWSLGATLAVDWGPARLQLGSRTHLQRTQLEEVIGRLPSSEFVASFDLTLHDDGATRVRLGARAQWTVRDAYGLPTEGHAVAGALTVEFGGDRRRRIPSLDPAEVASLRVASQSQPLETSPETSPETALESALESAEAAQTLLSNLPGQQRVDLEALADLLAQEAPDLDLESLAKANTEAQVSAALRVLRPVVAVAHGRQGTRLGVIEGRATRHAITERIDRASLSALTERYDPPEEIASLTPLSLDAFLRSANADAFSVFAPSGNGHRVLLQARSRWSRHMRRSLSGR